MTPASLSADLPATAWIEYKPTPDTTDRIKNTRPQPGAAPQKSPKRIESHFGPIDSHISNYIETYV